jgi:hypothetical protein
MRENIPIAIEDIVALAKALDERLVDEWDRRFSELTGATPSAEPAEDTLLQHQRSFAIAVLSCAEAKCEAILQHTAKLYRWRVPLCRCAGILTAMGAFAVVVSLTVDRPGVAVAAAVATLCAAVVELFFEYWLAPPQFNTDSNPVHIRIARALGRIAHSKGALEALSGGAPVSLRDAVNRANAACRDLMKDQALLADPRTWDEREVVAPLQA